MSAGLRLAVLAGAKARRMAELAVLRFGAAGHQVVVYPDREALHADAAGLAATDVILTMPTMPVTGADMAALPGLRAVVSMVLGIDNIDSEAATQLGIAVVNGRVPELNASMAEATVMLVLAQLYDLDRSRALIDLVPGTPHDRRGRMLRGRTVGLIGFGGIAAEVAALLRPWGVRLIASIRHPRPLPEPVRAVELDELLSESDVVLVLASLDARSRGLLDAAKLARMKPDVVFVNTARGGIVDEAALAGLCRQQPAMRVAVDVFAALPVAADHPLRSIPGAILTPHLIGHTQEATAALGEAMLANVACLAEGRLPASLCNPDVAPAWIEKWGRP